jgi:hypothetical protein
MAERPRIVGFGLLERLSVRDRLRGERMSAAAGKSLCSCTPTNVLRPWRRRPEKRADPLSSRSEPPLAPDRKATSPSRRISLQSDQ